VIWKPGGLSRGTVGRKGKGREKEASKENQGSGERIFLFPFPQVFEYILDIGGAGIYNI
jgi:hypothetical protein